MTELGVLREENHTDAVAIGRREVEPGCVCDALEETVRRLEQDPGAVAGLWIGAGSAAVPEIDQHFQRLIDHAMSVGTIDVGDHANAAGVAFECRVVQPRLAHLFKPRLRVRVGLFRVCRRNGIFHGFKCGLSSADCVVEKMVVAPGPVHDGPVIEPSGNGRPHIRSPSPQTLATRSLCCV